MLRISILALLAVGCASVSTHPAPRTVERVVIVETPRPAPVIVERHGHREGGHLKARHDRPRHEGSKRADSRYDDGSKRHGKSKRDAKAKHRMPEHRAKGMPPGHAGGKRPSKWSKKDRCDEQPNDKARENCRTKTARRKSASPTFGL